MALRREKGRDQLANSLPNPSFYILLFLGSQRRIHFNLRCQSPHIQDILMYIQILKLSFFLVVC